MLVYDPAGKPHDKEPVDVRECVESLGWTREPPELRVSAGTGVEMVEVPQSETVPAKRCHPIPGAPDTVAELRAWLKAHDVAVPHNASKTELLALYETANAGPA